MRRFSLLPTLSSLTLALVLVLTTVGGGVPTAVAQQSAFDVDKPVESIKRAVAAAESDSQLVALATALLEARADTKIRHSDYKQAVRHFQHHHPGFYGNFFGDPFYATYDIRYTRLIRKRQLAEIEVNPQNGFRNNTSFFCDPFSYDPAFGGICEGFNFAVSDFFHVPHFLSEEAPRRAATTSDLRSPSEGSPGNHVARLSGPRDEEPDTLRDDSRIPAAAVASTTRPANGRDASGPVESATPVEPVRTPDRLDPPVQLPDDLREAIEETAIELEQAEITLRLRQRYGDRSGLSPRERAEILSQFARTVYTPDGRANGPSRTIDQREIDSPPRTEPPTPRSFEEHRSNTDPDLGFTNRARSGGPSDVESPDPKSPKRRKARSGASGNDSEENGR